jgi:hypothetical protein
MRHFVLLLVLASLVFLTGCDNATDPPAVEPIVGPGTVSGIIHLDPDIQGTIDGTVVQLYTSRNDAAVMHATRSVVVDQTGNFTIDAVPSGTYYLGAWKDNDRNGLVSSGDFLNDRSSHENCCCQVMSGCSTVMCPCIIVVP